MLTVRKTVFLGAAAIFCLLFILLRGPSVNPLVRTTSHRDWQSKQLSKEEIERILEADNRPLLSANQFATLRDHLEYLYPYQGPAATKFPAYIWQTWKFTPAQGEFDERFRMTEASWTEHHPGYVHEVPQ
jgi:alpha 1,6-mannosyltransferase